MWENLKEAWVDGLLVVGWGWVLFHLIMIKLYGGIFTIGESHQWILWLEMALAVLIILLGIERLIKDLRR